MPAGNSSVLLNRSVCIVDTEPERIWPVVTGTSTSAVNSKWELMLNILLSGEFNFDQFGLLIATVSVPSFKLRAHMRNSMPIGMSLKARCPLLGRLLATLNIDFFAMHDLHASGRVQRPAK